MGGGGGNWNNFERGRRWITTSTTRISRRRRRRRRQRSKSLGKICTWAVGRWLPKWSQLRGSSLSWRCSADIGVICKNDEADGYCFVDVSGGDEWTPGALPVSTFERVRFKFWRWVKLSERRIQRDLVECGMTDWNVIRREWWLHVLSI